MLAAVLFATFRADQLLDKLFVPCNRGSAELALEQLPVFFGSRRGEDVLLERSPFRKMRGSVAFPTWDGGWGMLDGRTKV